MASISVNFRQSSLTSQSEGKLNGITCVLRNSRELNSNPKISDPERYSTLLASEHPDSSRQRNKIDKGVKTNVNEIGNGAMTAGVNEIGEGTSTDGNKIGKRARRAGHEKGKRAKKTGRETGKGAKKTGNQIGKGFKTAGNEIGKGFKTVGNEISKGFKTGINEIGKLSKYFIARRMKKATATKINQKEYRGGLYREIDEEYLPDDVMNSYVDPDLPYFFTQAPDLIRRQKSHFQSYRFLIINLILNALL